MNSLQMGTEFTAESKALLTLCACMGMQQAFMKFSSPLGCQFFVTVLTKKHGGSISMDAVKMAIEISSGGETLLTFLA